MKPSRSRTLRNPVVADDLGMPANSYEIQLNVTVPAVVDGRKVWGSCPQLDGLGAVDLARSWRDVADVLRGQGSIVGRLLAATAYQGYRVAVRGVLSGRMLAMGEWHQSVETGVFRPVGIWTAEEYIPLNPMAIPALETIIA